MKNKNQDLAAAMPPGHFRMILKKRQASSTKQQAPAGLNSATIRKQFKHN